MNPLAPYAIYATLAAIALLSVLIRRDKARSRAEAAARIAAQKPIPATA